MEAKVRAIYTLFCATLFSGVLDSQIIIPSEKSSIGIKGEVKSLKEIEYEAEEYFGELRKVGAGNRIRTYEFDDLDRLIYHEEIRNGKLDEHVACKYSKSGELEETRLNRRGVNYSHNWKHDSRGNVLEHVVYKNDTITLREFAQYDLRDSLTEYKSYGFDGKMKNFKSCEYDKNGLLVETTQYNDLGFYSREFFQRVDNKPVQVMRYGSNGKLIEVSTYQYDKSGRISIEMTNSSSHPSFHKKVYSYNSNGNLKEVILYRGEDSIEFYQIQKTSFGYDEQDRLVSEIKAQANEVFTEHLLKYDGFGNLIQEEFYFNHGTEGASKSLTEYEYDNRGNWVKCVFTYLNDASELIENKTKSIRERVIFYR